MWMFKLWARLLPVAENQELLARCHEMDMPVTYCYFVPSIEPLPLYPTDWGFDEDNMETWEEADHTPEMWGL